MPALIRFGICPIHGRVVSFNITDTLSPTISTGDICQTCYIEFIREHVTKLVDVRLEKVG